MSRVGCASVPGPSAPDDQRCTCTIPQCPTKAADGRCRAYTSIDYGDICAGCGYCLDGEF